MYIYIYITIIIRNPHPKIGNYLGPYINSSFNLIGLST